MKKFLSLLLAMTMLASMFTIAASANGLGSIAFYDAADGSIVTYLDGVDNVYANVTFTANKTGTANVIAAHYDIETGKLEKMESIDSVSMTAGVAVEYTTNAIPVADTDLLKVYAWDEETLAPLTNAGTIERDLLEELPTATVSAIKADADFALNFVADEVTDEQLEFYGDWKADFVFVANKTATFNANGTKDGYLVGQYDEFGPEFVKVPAADVTVTAGAPVSIMDAVGLNVTFRDVVETVKDFDCGVDYADAYLKANNGLEVSIALVLVNPENGNTYTIAEEAFDFNMPTATVTEIDVADADFALNFKADVATESQVATFGDWKADFVFITNKDATFNADGTKDGYLIGQYDEFGPEAVKVPATDLVVTAGEPVSVMGAAGFDVTYRDVVETVKEFNCGVNFTDAYLKANDGLEVSLALVIVNPVTGEAYTIAEKAFDFTLPTATVTELDVTQLPVDLNFALNFKADEVTEEQLALFGDWYADYELTVNKTATFNANGTADAYLAGQYDLWSKDWLSVPTTNATLEANTPVKVMETAAALMGSSGLKLTYKDVYTSVKDFDCGIYFSPEFLAANDGLEVTLCLKMYNPANEAESYIIGDVYTYNWTLPTATVTHLDTNNLDVEADFAMNFKANEATEEQLKTFGNWKADYAVTISKDVTLNANSEKDGYLLGQYDEFGEEWVKLPATDLVVPANTTINVLESAGMNVTYRDIVETVKDFDCGINFSKEFLAANDGVTATVELRIYNPVTGEAFVIGEPVTRTWKQPTATVTELDVDVIEGVDLDFALNFKADEVTEEQLAMFSDWYADYELTVNKTATFNANGTADGFLSGQYDAWSKNWVSVPFEDATLEANTPVRVMETAAALMGQSGLKLTYADIVNSVKDFNCGLAFTPEFLVANPDLEVTLALKMYNPNNENESYVIGRVYTFTPKTIPSIDKFIGKDVIYTHTLDTVEANIVTYDFADLFTVINGVPVDMDNLTVTGATYKDGKIIVEGFGTKTITVTDNYYCNTATATVTVNEPANVDKFEGMNRTVTHNLDTVVSGVYEFEFNRLFPVVEGAIVDWDNLTVTGATYQDGKIIVEGFGEKTITVTDNFYCNVATAIVKIYEPNPVHKFNPKFITVTHTLDTIESGEYTVDFEDLFDVSSDYPLGNIIVEGGVYKDGKITVTGLGTIIVTASDDFYAFPCPASITVKEPDSVDKFFGKDVVYTHTLDTIEDGVVTYTFEELFDVDETYPIKAITVGGDGTFENGVFTFEGTGDFVVTVTDNFYCNEAEAYITIFEPENVDKFTGNTVTKQHTLFTYENGVVTATLDELFTNNGYDVKEVTVGGDGIYADGKVSFAGTGTFTVTITDNFYCNEATATVVVNAPVAVDKFVGKDVTYTHTLDTIEENTATFDFAELFTTVGEYPVKDITVTGGTYADGKITVEGVGTFTVTATDNFFCNTATATVIIEEPANVDKFVATNKTIDLTVNTVGKDQTVNFTDLFTTVDGAVLKAVSVTVEGGSFADGVITVPGVAGTYTVTATDNFYCNEATATITVNDAANVDKWTGKTVSKKLAYGENTVTATLDELFTNNGYTTKTAVVGGDGTYANGVVTFTGAGTYKVTITDNFYCNTATATVTVANADPINKFTAKNPSVTHTLASIDAKAVTVKLGDIFGGTNVVTGNITVTIAGKATTVSAADWANATVTIPGTTGDVTVTINDNYYCNTATGKVTLKAPANVDKWTTTNKTINLTLDNYGTAQSINFADMFTAKSGAYIKTVSVTVNNGGSYASNKITVPGKAGTYTVTVTDNFYCNTATATITVNNPAKVTKWTAKSGLNYEVDAGASKTLKLSDIFTLNNNYKVGTVTYTVEEQGTKTVSGTAWANTQVTFPGAGTYTVTITDDLFSDATYEATVNVTEKVVEPVYKFKAVDKYIYLEHSTPEADGTITKDKDNGALTLGDVFVSTGNSTITNANVVATATASDYAEDVKDYTSTAKATITKSGSDWTQWPVTITGVGELTFTITDNDNCLTSQAIVGVSPYWIGDADGDDVIEGYEPPHYESSTYKYRLSTSVANLAKGDEKEITFNGLSESGIYAFCFNVNAATTLQVRCGNYSTIITMNQAGWTDAYGADEVLYITAGSKIYVKNLGNGAVTINGNETANRSMATYLCGADDMDFFPLVKWNSYQAGNLELPDPDDGEVPTPTPTPTPGADIPPIPAKTFDTWNGAYGSVNTTYGTQYWPGGAKKYEGSKISNYATDYYKAKGGSVTYTYNAPYTGVYVFQTYAGDYTKGTATFEVSVPGGYTWEVKRTSTGWSSADKTDLLIYLEKGENDIVVTWTGEGSAGLYEIDMGLFNESGDYSSMAFYDVCMSKLK